MQVTEWYIIRSLTLPSSWVSILIALLVTWIFIWRLYGREVEDWFSDTAIVFILVWKLSVIITDFGMVVEFPLTILYFNGGKFGVFLGLFVALGKLYFSLKKREFTEKDIQAMLVSFISIQTVYQFLMVALNEGLLWQKIMTIILFGTFVIFASILISKDEKSMQQVSIVLPLMHIIVSMLQPNGLFQMSLFVTICVSFFFNFLLFKRKSHGNIVK